MLLRRNILHPRRRRRRRHRRRVVNTATNTVTAITAVATNTDTNTQTPGSFISPPSRLADPATKPSRVFDTSPLRLRRPSICTCGRHHTQVQPSISHSAGGILSRCSCAPTNISSPTLRPHLGYTHCLDLLYRALQLLQPSSVARRLYLGHPTPLWRTTHHDNTLPVHCRTHTSSLSPPSLPTSADAIQSSLGLAPDLTQHSDCFHTQSAPTLKLSKVHNGSGIRRKPFIANRHPRALLSRRFIPTRLSCLYQWQQ